MHQHRAIRYIYLIIVLIGAISCKKDDEVSSKIPPEAVYDFVTLTESSPVGSTYEMCKSDDQPLITYTSTYDLANASTHVSVGDRLIICYSRRDGAVYTSGPINLYGYVTLSGTEQEVQITDSEDEDAWATPPLDLIAMWRTGQYLNVEAKIYVHEAKKPTKYIIAADVATIDQDIPDLYIIYENAEGNDGENRFSVSASFDISEIWQRETCQGVAVHYNTADGESTMTFNKQKQ